MKQLSILDEGQALATEGLEVWKDIIGYDYPYQVSSIGNVRLLPRMTCPGSQLRKERKKFIPGRIMPQRIRTGYLSVSFRRNKKSVDCVVHRLMGIAFIPNPDNLPVINHKNGIKTYNRVENLEWTTVKANTIHAYDMGLSKSGEDHWRSKLTNAQSLEIIKLKKSGMTALQIGKMFNVCKSTVFAITLGQNWKRLKTA